MYVKNTCWSIWYLWRVRQNQNVQEKHQQQHRNTQQSNRNITCVFSWLKHHDVYLHINVGKVRYLCVVNAAIRVRWNCWSFLSSFVQNAANEWKIRNNQTLEKNEELTKYSEFGNISMENDMKVIMDWEMERNCFCFHYTLLIRFGCVQSSHMHIYVRRRS